MVMKGIRRNNLYLYQQGRTYVGAMVGYSPGYFFLNFFLPLLLSPVPHLARPLSTHSQHPAPHLARPLSTPSPQIQRIPSLSQTILGGRRPECRFPHDLIRGIWFSLPRSRCVVLSSEFPFPTIHFAFARILAFPV